MAADFLIASEVFQLWGGEFQSQPVATPAAPCVARHDGSGKTTYSLVALGPQGTRSTPSPSIDAAGHATLRWDSVVGADAYLVLRNGQVITEPLRSRGIGKGVDRPRSWPALDCRGVGPGGVVCGVRNAMRYLLLTAARNQRVWSASSRKGIRNGRSTRLRTDR